MRHALPRFIVVFLDGVGLGPAIAANPLADARHTPFLSELLEQPLVQGAALHTPDRLLQPIDACLGVSGLPQSATGQTSLYTGCNAPRFRRQHQTGFANGSLRQLIEAHGLLRRVRALGLPATLANLYSPAYFEAIAQRRQRYAVGTLLNLTAGLPFRMQAEYEQAAAVFWDITGELAPYRGVAAAAIAPAEAGRRLADLGDRHAVTLFECFLPDFAGHAQNWERSLAVLARVDQFLASLVRHRAAGLTVLICSDHGNVEDLSTSRHTPYPVPLIAIGPEAQRFRGVADLTGLTPTLLNALAAKSPPAPQCAPAHRRDAPADYGYGR